MTKEINIFQCLDFIRDNAKPYAQAKADRVYIEEFRKTLKAKLMLEALKTGIQAANAQETYAYSHNDYKTLLDGLKEAVRIEEEFRWLMVAAQAKIETWRTLSANERAESKVL